MSDPQEPLRGPHFEARPKEVLHLDPFKDYTGLIKTAPYSGDYVEFVRRIEGGLELGFGFYRKHIDDTHDELLEWHGIKHVHLGGQDSDVLLFAAEYADVVILLESTTISISRPIPSTRCSWRYTHASWSRQLLTPRGPQRSGTHATSASPTVAAGSGN